MAKVAASAASGWRTPHLGVLGGVHSDLALACCETMKVCSRCQLEYRDDTRTNCLVDGTPLTAVKDPRLGRVVMGRYAVEEQIGAGGMAIVYRGHAIASGRPVAIKIMHDVLSGDQALRERFRREVRNAAAIAHDNVVEMLDAGETEDGRPLLVMELLDGETLREMMNRVRLPLLTFSVIAVQIARGLARAHDLGIVHRDLKPENVFIIIRDDGAVVAKLVDFGIARARGDGAMTMAGALLGTPAYLAPERVRGGETEPSSDLYSFGIMLYEMITGELPFESKSMQGYLFHHLESDPPRAIDKASHCPPALDALITRLMGKTKRDRNIDSHQVARELEAIRASIAPNYREPEWTDRSVSVLPTSEPRSSATSLGHDRWTRRAVLLQDIVRRAYIGQAVPSDLLVSLTTLARGAAQLETLRTDRDVHQQAIDKVDQRSRDVRESLGRAVHSLGRDLSEMREKLEALRIEVARRELEVNDLEFQIHSLRTNLVDTEGEFDKERRQTESSLTEYTEKIEVLLSRMGDAAQNIATVLRTTPTGSALLGELD
jgi:serine/threonine-protein kinase